MKVCILTTSFPAHKHHHQSPFILQLAEALARNKNKVDVICPYYHHTFKKEETINDVRIHRFQYLYPAVLQGLHKGGGLPHNLKHRFISKIELMPYLFTYFMKAIPYARKCDIIHAQWSLSGLVGVYLKKMFNKPLIVSTRGVAVHQATKSRWMRPILKNVFKNADFITPNNVHQKEIIQKLGIPSNKIFPVPNGVNTTIYKPRNKAKVRKKHHLPKNEKIILFVGWLIPRKGVVDLARAFTTIHRKHPNTMLVMIGQGSEKTKIKKLLKAAKFRIVDATTPENVAEYMAAADMFVLPSLAEGRPNVLYEAMLSQLPIIATNIGGTNELINNKNGVLIPTKSPKAIEKAMQNLLINKGKATKLAKKARADVLKKKVSWDDCAKNFIKIYKKVKSDAKES